MRKAALATIILFILLYILPLGVRPVIIPDESRYAEISREMVETGDWVVPKLNGLRYFEKPVAGYWLNSVSMLAFGENAFAIRFPSAVSAGLSALIIFFLVRIFAGGDRNGIMAAAVFLSFMEVFFVGVFSVLDSMLALFLTASLAFFFMAWHNRDSKREYYRFMFLFGVFSGIACLTKGFLALVVPVAVIVPFVIWEGEWKKLFKIPWIPLITATLVLLPWGILIHLREPDFWNFFFWNEHVRRFMADNAQHKESFFFFFLILPLGALPWTFLFPAAVSGLRKKGFSGSFTRYSVCWLAFPFFFFSLSSGKLGTYILPCFPPLAVLMTIGMVEYFESGKQKLFNLGSIMMAVITVAVGITIIIIQTGTFKGFILYQQNVKAVMLILGIAAFSAFLVAAARAKDNTKKIILYTLSPVLFLLTTHFLLPDIIAKKKAPGNLLLKNKDKISEETIIVSHLTTIRAVCWFYKRNDVYQLKQGGELCYGLSQEDSKHRVFGIKRLKKLIANNSDPGRIVLFSDMKKYTKWRKTLPVPIFEEINHEEGFVFAQY